ncbi:MAG: hypothetical protein LBB26_00425 [Puniceicoccales bacterium]|jgi:hypothetical protein|nr:hypothetical protein [Puniceicoccales bacterium]
MGTVHFRTPHGELEAWDAVKLSSVAVESLRTDKEGKLLLAPTGTDATKTYIGIKLQRVTIDVIRNEFGHNAVAAFFIYIGGRLAGFFCVSPEKIKTNNDLQKIAQNTMQFILDHAATGSVNTVSGLMKAATNAATKLNAILKDHKIEKDKDDGYTADEMNKELDQKLKIAIADQGKSTNKPHFEKARKELKVVIQLQEQINELRARYGSALSDAVNKLQVPLLEAAQKVTGLPDGQLNPGDFTRETLTGDAIPKAFEGYKTEQNIEKKDGKLQVKKGDKFEALTTDQQKAMKAFEKLMQLHNQAKVLADIAKSAPDGHKSPATRMESLARDITALMEKFPETADPNVAGGITKADIKLPKEVTKNNLIQVRKAIEALTEKFNKAVHVDKSGKLAKDVGKVKKGSPLDGVNRQISDLLREIGKEMKSIFIVAEGLKRAQSSRVRPLDNDEFNALAARLQELKGEQAKGASKT